VASENIAEGVKTGTIHTALPHLKRTGTSSTGASPKLNKQSSLAGENCFNRRTVRKNAKPWMLPSTT
jgi:hypothetical protein